MRYLLIFCLLLTGCLQFHIKDGHLLIQDKNRDFSCYSFGANYVANCCYPYREKVMMCLYENSTTIDSYSASIVLKIVPDNTSK